MKFNLKRFNSVFSSTPGMLFIGDQFLMYTLEDTIREIPGVPVEEWKLKGSTAIPVGTYDVGFNHSTKYNKIMPYVFNVPGYTGIMIHSGNTHDDTEGCILVGEQLSPSHEMLLKSRDAFNILESILELVDRRGEDITLTIYNSGEDYVGNY